MGEMPVRYLGLPLLHSKLRKGEFSPLIDKINGKINNWTARCLSFSGRLQLISSVIYGLVNFWLSAFALPKSCLKKIEQICNRYLWKGEATGHTPAKVAWSTVCLPKSEGGLELRNFSLWNKVLNLRLIWLIFNSRDSLWVAWTRSHMLKEESFWNTEVKDSHSWIWKFILSLRPLARDLVGCRLKNGETIKFWFDDWTNLGPLIKVSGVDGPLKMGIPLNSNVADASSVAGWTLPSNRVRDPKIFQIRTEISSIPPPDQSRGPDIFTWGPRGNRTRTFSTKVSWETVRFKEEKKSWFKAFWFKRATRKHAFNFWTANYDRMPAKTRLNRWGLNLSTTCDLCNIYEETRNHLSLSCNFAMEMWSQVFLRLNQQGGLFRNWESMISWMMGRSMGTSTTLKKIVVQAVIYFIWRERNTRHHGGSPTTSSQLFKQLDRTIRDTLLAHKATNQCKGLLTLWLTNS